MQESATGDEEEQVLALLLSKGAAESALADEMGRLKVQEEVTPVSLMHVLKHKRDCIENCMNMGSLVPLPQLADQWKAYCSCPRLLFAGS